MKDLGEDISAIVKEVTHKNDEITVSCLDDPGSLCIVKDWISTGCFPMDMKIGRASCRERL